MCYAQHCKKKKGHYAKHELKVCILLVLKTFPDLVSSKNSLLWNHLLELFISLTTDNNFYSACEIASIFIVVNLMFCSLFLTPYRVSFVNLSSSLIRLRFRGCVDIFFRWWLFESSNRGTWIYSETQWSNKTFFGWLINDRRIVCVYGTKHLGKLADKAKLFTIKISPPSHISIGKNTRNSLQSFFKWAQ